MVLLALLADWLPLLLGRLHPLVVHFPVSLLTIAGLLEVYAAWRKQAELRAGIRALVWLGALSSVPAALFGWLLADSGSYAGETLQVHQWTGIATMVLALGCVLALRSGRERLFQSLLALSVIGVIVAGHYGASLTHGEEYLSGVFTAPELEEKGASMVAVRNASPENPSAELSMEVRTILAHHCYKCHGPVKVKGGLRLDSKSAVFKGGEGGPIIVPGRPDKSELIRRITLPAEHEEAMPAKGQRLTEAEIATLTDWVEQGAPWPSGREKSLYRVAALAPRTPSLPPAAGELKEPIDRLVNAYFHQTGGNWPALVDDRTFLRRVYLDVVGLLPRPEQVDAFVADTSQRKRERMVDHLLAQSDAYAQHWLTFWNDALRNDYTGTGYITGGRFAITSWLYESLRRNKPYNVFVRELLNPNSASEGFIRGIQWRGTINASQRTEMQAAQNVAQVLLGLNLKCASCHDSFISDWKLTDAYAFANLFADSTLEIHRCDKPTGKKAGYGILFQDLGTVNSGTPKAQRLRELADFMTQPGNGRLYRTVVNRVWAQLLGRGLVEPVDGMDNLPWSQDVLDWLASDFAANGYDLKKLLRTILVSRTYQLPSVGLKEAGLVSAPTYQFTGPLRRRLTAEQFTDAVSIAIGPVYPDSAIVYKHFPGGIRKALPFARAGLVQNDRFLTALGRPNRETVSTGRTSSASLLQALELTNGTAYHAALERAAHQWQKRFPDSRMLVTQLYRNALGRQPGEKEIALAVRALGPKPGVPAVQDLLWAMTLHPEFQLIY